MGGDERVAPNLAHSQLAWLANTPLMDALLERMQPQASADAQRNAVAVMVAVARSQLTSPLAEAFTDAAIVERLLDAAFAPSMAGRVRLALQEDAAAALLSPGMDAAKTSRAHR